MLRLLAGAAIITFTFVHSPQRQGTVAIDPGLISLADAAAHPSLAADLALGVAATLPFPLRGTLAANRER